MTSTSLKWSFFTSASVELGPSTSSTPAPAIRIVHVGKAHQVVTETTTLAKPVCCAMRTISVQDLLGQTAPSVERERRATCVKTKPPTGQARLSLLAGRSLAGLITPSAELVRHAILAVTRPSMH